ncbi:MAG: hypothetical protein ABI686_07510 [Acidobacteriota bacterium]
MKNNDIMKEKTEQAAPEKLSVGSKIILIFFVPVFVVFSAF